jgi:2-amino-4-hydroxy-6-hydroxymethyldihydropteridine diphosphokinase
MRIEQDHGRVRGNERNAARTIDIDILLYDNLAIDSARLTLPHPRMHERAFVLRPLAEIAPGAEVPGHGKAADLLRAMPPAAINAVQTVRQAA